MKLDPKLYTHVTTEHCIASSVGNGKNLRLLVVTNGNVAHFKVTNHYSSILYEGRSSEQAAEVFNETVEKAELIVRAAKARNEPAQHS